MPTQVTPSHRLLVVDDEPDLRTLYELTLLREGYDVESAGSVEDAWALLQQRGPGGYHLVITDMRLPDGTGLDLLRRIDDAGRHEKAVVITAYGSPENAVEALKAGAYDYLTKPVDLRQFRAVVASALGRAPAASGTAGASWKCGRSNSTIHAGTTGTAGTQGCSPRGRADVGAATHRGRLFGHEPGALAGAEGGTQHGAGAGPR
jgi:two-component system response regulator PilR (NtrC family)